MRSNPRVRDPHSVGPNFGACAVRPRCVNSIVIGRDVASYLNRELLDRVGLKGDSFGRVRGDPVGDVILSHGRGTDKWPANKILVPQRAILLQVVGFHVSQCVVLPSYVHFFDYLLTNSASFSSRLTQLFVLR